MRKFGSALLTGAMVVGLAASANAALDKDELKCEAAMGKNLAKQVAAQNKCLTSCLSGVSKAVGVFADCQPPYAGLAATCINDPIKGPKAKAVAAIVKACPNASASEPECYPLQSGGTTADTVDDRTTATKNTVDTFVGLVICEDFVTVLNKGKYKCATSLAKILAKQVAGLDKLYAKCQGAFLKGSVTYAACVAVASDPTTSAAIAALSAKAAAGIEKACFTAPAVAPTCYGVTPLTFTTGTGWVNLVNSATGGPTNLTYCESPSGAFIN